MRQAISHDDAESLDLALDAGASPWDEVGPQERQSALALALCCRDGHAKLARELLARGARPT